MRQHNQGIHSCLACIKGLIFHAFAIPLSFGCSIIISADSPQVDSAQLDLWQ